MGKKLLSPVLKVVRKKKDATGRALTEPHPAQRYVVPNMPDYWKGALILLNRLYWLSVPAVKALEKARILGGRVRSTNGYDRSAVVEFAIFELLRNLKGNRDLLVRMKRYQDARLSEPRIRAQKWEKEAAAEGAIPDGSVNPTGHPREAYRKERP